MSYKKLSIWILSVFFVVIVVISMIFAFSVNKIDTEYTLIGEIESKSAAIDEKLNSFLGKNLLFLNEKEIEDVICKDPYTQCVSVKKVFPNTLKVCVRERKEFFTVNYGNNTFIADEKGFVLKNSDQNNGLIELSFDDIELFVPTVGQTLNTSDDSQLSLAFKIIDSVDIIDCVKKIIIVKNFGGTMDESFDLEFETYTGTTIVVKKFTDDGFTKTKNVFKAFNSVTSEYQKSFYFLEVYKTDAGELRYNWTEIK